MVHPASFGVVSAVQPLSDLHHRQSRMARHHAAAQTGRVAAVAGEERCRHRARLHRQSAADRAWPLRTRARSARRRRSRRRAAPGARSLSIGRADRAHRNRRDRGLPRPARPRRPHGAHGPAPRRQGFLRRDARRQARRRRRRCDRQGLQRGEGRRQQGRRQARRGVRRRQPGSRLCAVPRSVPDAQGKVRRCGEPGADRAEGDHGAAGHRRMVARPPPAGAQAARPARLPGRL